MTEKKIKGLFYWPVAIIVSLILLPFKLLYGVLWLIMKPLEAIDEEIRWWLYEYSLFLIRQCDEAKEIKNPEARRILGFKDNEVSD